MVCTDWPNITAPYGPGVGRRRKRCWSLKVTLHNSLFFCCWCCREDGGGGALALKVSWHNSLEFGNAFTAAAALFHSTGQLVVNGTHCRVWCLQSMCGEEDKGRIVHRHRTSTHCTTRCEGEVSIKVLLNGTPNHFLPHKPCCQPGLLGLSVQQKPFGDWALWGKTTTLFLFFRDRFVYHQQKSNSKMWQQILWVALEAGEERLNSANCSDTQLQRLSRLTSPSFTVTLLVWLDGWCWLDQKISIW